MQTGKSAGVRAGLRAIWRSVGLRASRRMCVRGCVGGWRGGIFARRVYLGASKYASGQANRPTQASNAGERAGLRAISAAPVAGVPVADRLRALGMARLMVYEARGARKAYCLD